MRVSRTFATAASLLACAGLAQAQEVHFNEIFASHTGNDDQEYIELIGTPGMSLDGFMVVMVDGDSPFAAGILDRAWNLTGHTMPADGYFVMGDVAVVNLDYDLAQGPHNGGVADNIENGSNTYYLIETTDPVFVESFHNSDLDTDDDGITLLTTTPGLITPIEIVADLDEDFATDETFDGALVLGPDLAGPWEPAGYFKPEDHPNGWCTDEWLDFSLSGLTPGTMNPASNCTKSGGGGGGPIGNNYCGPANLNSTGLPAVMSAFGSTAVVDNDVELTASQMPAKQFGFFIVSQTQGFVPNPGGSQGNLCLSGNIGRYNAFVLNSGAAGEFSLQIDLTNVPTNPPSSVMAGESWKFQAWFRDNNPGPTSNFTDGIEIDFN